MCNASAWCVGVREGLESRAKTMGNRAQVRHVPNSTTGAVVFAVDGELLVLQAHRSGVPHMVFAFQDPRGRGGVPPISAEREPAIVAAVGTKELVADSTSVVAALAAVDRALGAHSATS